MEQKSILLTSTVVLLIALASTIGIFYGSVFAKTPATVPATANIPEKSELDTLFITGTGIVNVKPDRVKITLTISAEAKSAEDAIAETSEIYSNLLAQLQSTGVSREDVETLWFNISPVYDYYSDQPPILRGYRVDHTLLVTVVTEDPTQLGERGGLIIDLAVSSGVNLIQGVQFTAADEALTGAEHGALANAVKDAQKRAQVITDSLGVKLISVHSITESSFYYPPPIPYARAEVAGPDAAKAFTELAPSSFQVSATVQITYIVGVTQ